MVNRFKLVLIFQYCFLLCVLLVLVSCGSHDDFDTVYEERAVEEIYYAGFNFLNKGKFRNAAAEFDEVERQHPYSIWARRSLLMSAYAYYKNHNYESAILTARRFLALHPGNKSAAYAYYLIGQSYYEQISDIERDQKSTEQALSVFYELKNRYPESEYTRDAQLKIDFTLEHLAAKELSIGLYYMKKSSYVSAINRFRNIVLRYQRTSYIEEALHRLVECYMTLGLVEEARSTAATLGYNYPDSVWYKDSYALFQE